MGSAVAVPPPDLLARVASATVLRDVDPRVRAIVLAALRHPSRKG